MIQDDFLGDFNLADEDVFDVQTLTDAMMTTGQSLATVICESAGTQTDDARTMMRFYQELR